MSAKCPAPGDGLLARLVTWLVPSTVGFAPSADWVEAVLWLSPAGARTGDILPCGKMWELPYYKDGNLMGFHTCLLGDFMPLGIIGWFKHRHLFWKRMIFNGDIWYYGIYVAYHMMLGHVWKWGIWWLTMGFGADPHQDFGWFFP